MPDSIVSDLVAGVARESLAPRVGMRLAGSLRDTLSGGIHQPLSITALYLRENGHEVVILGCDLILMPPEDAWQVRLAVGAALNVPAEQVMVAFSHSHATPSPVSWGEYDYVATEGERAEVSEFFDTYRKAAVSAAYKAQQRAVPARVESGSGESDINVNRRERRADGQMMLGSNPSGPADREVGVVRIDAEGGAPLGLLFNYACHPDILGPKSSLISPDFVGPARDAAEAVTGATALFLQGAAGDIYPCTGIVNGDAGVDVATRLGRRLGAEAARVYETIDTASEPAERVAWISTNSITTNWHYRNRPRPQQIGLTSARVVLDLPTRPLPPVEEARALVETRERELEAVPLESTLSQRLIASRRLAWARIQREAAERGGPDALQVELQAIRLGDTAIIAVPGELFTEIGLAIKDASPFERTIVSAYSNGVFFYIPTEAAFHDGGYEVNSHQNYLRPSGPTSDWEHRLIDAATELLQRIA